MNVFREEGGEGGDPRSEGRGSSRNVGIRREEKKGRSVGEKSMDVRKQNLLGKEMGQRDL